MVRKIKNTGFTLAARNTKADRGLKDSLTQSDRVTLTQSEEGLSKLPTTTASVTQTKRGLLMQNKHCLAEILILQPFKTK